MSPDRAAVPSEDLALLVDRATSVGWERHLARRTRPTAGKTVAMFSWYRLHRGTPCKP